MQWIWSSFEQLKPQQLYDLLKLRQDVFIIEQQCFYSDLDGLDQNCLHLMGYEGDDLFAYLRLIPAAHHHSGNIALGRILTSEKARGQGMGKQLMTEAMNYLHNNYQGSTVQMSAQRYLQAFYEGFGFRTVGYPYDEDGIAHIEMVLDEA